MNREVGATYLYGVLCVFVVVNVLFFGYMRTRTWYFGPLPEHVWMYWEDLPNSHRPGYIELAIRAMEKNAGQELELHILNEKTLLQYLPNLRDDLISKLNMPQRTDYYRAQLLYQYGGVWLDADTIVIKSLQPLVKLLRFHDFVGFGCFYSDESEICSTTFNGYPVPSNWVMVSRAHTTFFRQYIDSMDVLLDEHDAQYFKDNYFALGMSLLIDEIRQMKKNDPYWDYKHYTSRCVDRDSHGTKFINTMMTSTMDIDENCRTDLLLVPFYNTAPGFPDWFKEMPADQLLQEDFLISKLFREALVS